MHAALQRTEQVAQRLSSKELVPEFRPDPALTALTYSQDHRRCRYSGEYFFWKNAAVANEGFTAGRQQFTVPYIGVAVANAPRAGREMLRQGVFLEWDGTIYTPECSGRSYTTAKPFRAGSRVTMRLDFDRGTASYEVDGVDLGMVKGLILPEGPLYPAVVFDK
eukprot:EG_transcript_38409